MDKLIETLGTGSFKHRIAVKLHIKLKSWHLGKLYMEIVLTDTVSSFKQYFMGLEG